jgi:arylsulfatase A-like enzyme
MPSGYSRRLTGLFALMIAGAAGCMRPAQDSGRAIVIGIDGAARPMVVRMLSAGELPNLAAIAQRGTFGRMRPEGPLLSPRIWTSLVTGKSPEQHGIKNWVWFDDEKQPRLYTSRDRRVPALWNILGDAGRSVASVNWLITHPPESVEGVMVSDHVLPTFSAGKLRIARKFAARQMQTDTAATEIEIGDGGSELPSVAPERWRDTITERRASPRTHSEVTNPFETGEAIEHAGLSALARMMWESFENDGVIADLAIEIQSQMRPDLMLVYLPGIDRSSHLIWPRELYFDDADGSRSAEEDAGTEADRDRIHFNWLRTYYRYVDDLVGALTRGYTERDLVIVLSDHSFERAPDSGWPPGRHDSDAARDGIFLAKGPGVRSTESDNGPVVSMLDLTPSLLAWLRLPVAEDMSGDHAAFLALEADDVNATVATVASYGTVPVRATGTAGDTDDQDDDARIENLRLLGYVD